MTTETATIVGVLIGAGLAFLGSIIVSLLNAKLQRNAQKEQWAREDKVRKEQEQREDEARTHREQREDEARLRDERIIAYSAFFEATINLPTNREQMQEITRAYSRVELLTGSREMSLAASKVWTDYGASLMTHQSYIKNSTAEAGHASNKALNKAISSREEFVNMAREEVGVTGEYIP